MAFDTITLQCFLAAAETGSFTRAAQRVGRTQSAVSQQMTKLESLLGKPLFIRGKRLVLSPEGEVFLGYARQMFALNQEVLDRFREPELEGEVRFGLPEDFASVFLSGVLADFAHIHPLILLNIECDLTLNLYSRFKNREFDLVLVKMNRPQDFPDGLRVWSEKLEWVTAPGMGDVPTPVPLVLSPRPCVYRARTISSLEAAGIRWRHVFSSPSYAGTVAAVKAGLGITVLPRNMIPPNLKALRARRLPELSDTHVSLLKHDSKNSAVASFEEFVLQRLLH